MMKVLGIYGSPRKGGNSDLLLDEALKGAESAGSEISRIYARDLRISGCRGCGGCEKTGRCVVDDEMQSIYPLIGEADVIIVATPVQFYNVSSQLKLLIDRCQALWSKRMIEKTREERRFYDSGRGYVIAVGATRGEKLFEGVQLTGKYFFDALDMSYEGGIFLKGIDEKGAVLKHPESLQQAFDLGRNAVEALKSPQQ
jgi:multimeric flavodoxin WrbA